MVGAVAIRRIHSGLRSLLAIAIFVGMVCSLVSPAFAAGGQTGILTGTVINSATQQPIAGATVSAAAASASYTTKTAANGVFTIVGVSVDTYVVSVSAPGFQTAIVQAATVTGDQTLSLATFALSKLTVIGRVGARSASGAFQPTQTVDSYTVTGARLTQTAASPADNSLNDILLSAPGVTLTESGIPTIRGGSGRELGYQFDGVSFDEPFLGQNAGGGLYSGLQSVQVVEGVGDASQGGLGAGVINVIPKRGTYPAFGALVVQAGGPNFANIADAEYGFATSDGKLSNYISYSNDRHAPYYGFHAQDSSAYGNYFGYSLVNSSQLVDNFVYKFGKDNSQSVQVLYNNLSRLEYGNVGGIPAGTFPGNPNALPYYNFDSLTGPGAGFYTYSAPIPYQPATNVAVTSPELAFDTQTRFLKFEYDNNLNSSTFLDVRYFNQERLDYSMQEYELGPVQQGVGQYQINGGPVVGGNFDLTHSFSDKLTVTLNGTYETTHPVWDAWIPIFGVAYGGLYGDFAPPAGGAGACAAPPNTLGQANGYVYCQTAGTGLEPSFGLDYHGTYFQNYGAGLRFQYTVSKKLRADFGLRYEGQNQHWINPYAVPGQPNPYDVPPQIWTAQITNPKILTPRIAVSYQLDPNDSLRASYGRSAVFQVGQLAGTPMGLLGGNQAALAALPPNLTGATALFAGAPVANQCGTTLNGAASLFPCQNYLQQLYWAMDRNLDAPDAGGAVPSVYNNYDFSWAHQFNGGYAFKLTPFYKLGVNLPTSGLLKTLAGGQQIFSESSKGFNRTTGAEFQLTTPDKTVGFSGFISGTYQNVLQSAPPLSNGEFDGVPQLSTATIALGNVYRAGYVSPVGVRIGGTYTTRNGFSVTPVIQLDSGFPYNVGDLIAATVGGVNANIPQVNFGAGLPILLGYQNQGGAQLNTNYYDPAYSGSQFVPNIAATRGTPTSPNSGGQTWTPNVRLDLTFQYKHGKDTIGLQIADVVSNGYNGTTPAVNPFYQPVANGVSGPQTGYNTCIAQYGTARGCAAIPTNAYAFTNGAYLLTNGNTGNWQLAPLSPTVFNLFYKRQL